jgi:two-component system, NarL family, response regulator
MKKKTRAHTKQIRVIVADDHPVVREGLAALIRSQPDMKLACEVEDGRAAVRQYLKQRPDVILLDLRMPEMDGITATKAILEEDPKAKVIVLSTYRGGEDVYQALKAGAKSYLLKDSRREELVNAIRTVNEGQVKMSPLVAAHLMKEVQSERLTKREAQIMKLVVAGKSNKEIGVALGVTEGTIKVHAGHVFKKLGASGRTEAIRIALERGVVHLPTL